MSNAPTFDNNGFTWNPIPSPASDGGYTRSEPALYGAVSLASAYSGDIEQVGLCQNIRYEGQTGNAPVNGIGEPWSENKPGQMYFNVTMGNFSIRKRRLMDLVNLLYPNFAPLVTPMDFRTIPFMVDLSWRMVRPYVPPPLGQTIPPVDDVTETLFGLWIQTWTAEWSDGNSLRLEGVTGWASGLGFYRGGGLVGWMGQSTGANGNVIPATTPIP